MQFVIKETCQNDNSSIVNRKLQCICGPIIQKAKKWQKKNTNVIFVSKTFKMFFDLKYVKFYASGTRNTKKCNKKFKNCILP